MMKFSEYMQIRLYEDAVPGKPDKGLGDKDGTSDTENDVNPAAERLYFGRGIPGDFRQVAETMRKINSLLLMNKARYWSWLQFLKTDSNLGAEIRSLAEELPDDWNSLMGMYSKRLLGAKDMKSIRDGMRKDKKDKNPYRDRNKNVLPLDNPSNPDGKNAGGGMGGGGMGG